MRQEEIVALVLKGLREQVPAEAKIFNISFDFVNECSGDLQLKFFTEHQGHRTMVVMISGIEEGRLVVEALATMLM